MEVMWVGRGTGRKEDGLRFERFALIIQTMITEAPRGECGAVTRDLASTNAMAALF